MENCLRYRRYRRELLEGLDTTLKVLRVRDWSIKFKIDDVKFLWYTEVDPYGDYYYDTGVLAMFKHDSFGRYELIDIGVNGTRIYLPRPIYGHQDKRSKTNKAYEKQLEEDLLNNGYTLDKLLWLSIFAKARITEDGEYI
mgnify:FL=1